jgi:hypothetical protein
MAKGDPSAGASMGFLGRPAGFRRYSAKAAGFIAALSLAAPLKSFSEGKDGAFLCASMFSIMCFTGGLVELAWCVQGRVRWKSRSRRVLGWARAVSWKFSFELLGGPLLFAGVHYAVSAINLESIPWWGPAVAGLIAAIAHLRWLLLRDGPRDVWREDRRIWLEAIGKP